MPKIMRNNIAYNNSPGLGAEDIVNLIYPIGSYYISENNTTPDELFGVGTWEQIKGKTIIGVDDTDSDFYEGVDGGSKTFTLGSGNLPSHTHSISSFSATSAINNVSHTHAVTIGHSGTHTHEWPSSSGFWEYGHNNSTIQAGTGLWGARNTSLPWTPNHTHIAVVGGQSANHTHIVTIPTRTTTSVGSGTAVKHITPYITAYIWKRIA